MLSLAGLTSWDYSVVASGNPIVHLIELLEAFIFSQITLFGVDIEWIVLWMFAPMAILTVYFGFINLSSFKRAYQILIGRYQDKDAPGEVTQFQALATALSGTVGLGNIGGVAIAVAIGGPGATLWMIIIGLCAMSLKYAECTLGVKYRVIHEDGTVSGGPMYYLKRGLEARGMSGVGKLLAYSYAGVAVMALLPQMSQVNQAYSQISATTGYTGPSSGYVFGIGLAILTGIVIIGGIKSIANVTSRLVPLMAFIYVGTALIILVTHASEIPAAFGIIFTSAFTPEGVEGGIVGAIVIGMRRAIYSSEAGLGTATIAHSAARTNEPVSEGMVALMEPFIDTVVICTITALVIVITGAYTFRGADGELLGDIQMTSAAFGSVISWFPYVLAGAVMMFAFSTIISWGYYSLKVWGFIFGRSPASELICKLLFCVLVVPGAIMDTSTVIALVDSLYFTMAIPNIIGIYLMAGELKRDTKDYLHRLKTGQIPMTNPPKGYQAKAKKA